MNEDNVAKWERHVAKWERILIRIAGLILLVIVIARIIGAELGILPLH